MISQATPAPYNHPSPYTNTPLGRTTTATRAIRLRDPLHKNCTGKPRSRHRRREYPGNTRLYTPAQQQPCKGRKEGRKGSSIKLPTTPPPRYTKWLIPPPPPLFTKSHHLPPPSQHVRSSPRPPGTQLTARRR
ncbi:unnamed protein product [Tuber melanosporum]|uniref:(Perigord truffle) hypothetical protein n=1 Tax=Tuber melanosporum (strain Mel28) TaxID=656061 RepID=D5GAJ0_TUBMM|nr:uncharacterized protein GSTUM_00003609001 [Tuber melanosporum]CAZ81533.1 unnamed protein product [Tuber melanosporum]